MLAVLLAVVVASAGKSDAHDLYAAFVQHHVRLDAGARHLDVTIDLTFFEEWSARERQRMDLDRDGRIARSEIEAYLMKHGSEFASRVKLLVAGREVPLTELYEPEIDLLGNNRVGPAHHRLRFYFFASTPSSLRAGDSVVIEDRLWPDTKALITLDGAAANGGKIDVEKPDDPACAPAASGEARAFKFRVVAPPAAGNQPKPENLKANSLSAPEFTARIASRNSLRLNGEGEKPAHRLAPSSSPHRVHPQPCRNHECTCRPVSVAQFVRTAPRDVCRCVQT